MIPTSLDAKQKMLTFALPAGRMKMQTWPVQVFWGVLVEKSDKQISTCNLWLHMGPGSQTQQIKVQCFTVVCSMSY